MKTLFEKVKEFVDEAFNGNNAHFVRTVFWLEKLLPNITDTERIAAYAHDIERAFRENKNAPENYLNPEFLKKHQEKGAQIISDFLRKEHASEEMISKVTHLVSKHEIGGDLEQDALMSADSISFFETNAEMFVTKKAPVEGYTSVKAKLDWMFNRITTDEAKDFARVDYEKWSKELEKYNN